MITWAWIDRHHRGPALVLLLALLATGFALHRDYGVPWDEPIQRNYGQLVSRYVLQGDTRLFSDPNRVYGPAHELALLAAERLLHARDTPDVFAVRHLFNFLVFVAGVGFLYRLGLKGLGSGTASLLVCLSLVLSPVLFGHAFYNSKDLPFLAFFLISACSLLSFLEGPRIASALRHALASAWLIAIRVPGVLIPALTVAGVLYCALRAATTERRRNLLVHLGLYLVATTMLTWAFWPTLWRDPWTSFWNALQTMSRYPWEQNVLYRGRLVPATQLPWHYAAVWIAITTPILYLAGFVLGLPVVVTRVMREMRGPTTAGGIYSLLVLSWLSLPLVSVVLLHSVMYDGGRQLFFVYPALLLISMEGFLAASRAISQRWQQAGIRILAGVGTALAVASVVDTGAFMVEAHPHEHVFFNALVGGLPGARFRYEMDYWGLSYRRGLEAIVKYDSDPAITVFAADPPGVWNAGTLPYPDRQRLVFVDSLDQAKYFLGAYRLRQEEYPYTDVVHRVEVTGAPILTVAAVHPELSLTPDTVPGVAAARLRNESITAGIGEDALRARLEKGLTACLSRFVRGAEAVQVEVSSPGLAELRQGRLTSARIRIRGGEVGDFRYSKPGLPLGSLDVILGDLVVDVARLDQGELAPARMGEVTLAELVLDARAINDALGRRADNQKDLRVHFERGAIRAEWLGRPAAEATLRLWVAPDPWRIGSDNFWFELTSLRVSGLRLPVAWLLQSIFRSFSPVIDPDRFSGRIVLGTLQLEDQQLRLGTR